MKPKPKRKPREAVESLASRLRTLERRILPPELQR